MASAELMSDKSLTESPSEELKSLDVDTAIVPVSASTSQEYSEYLTLQQRFENDPKAYKKMLRKLDLRIVVILWMFYLMNGLDRSNAGNVRIYSFLPDTHTTAAQYNTGLTIYAVFYGALEVPAQMILQKVGPRKYLSTVVTCWGIVTVCHMAIKNHQQFWALRALLGIFEAGLYQGCFYTLSRWFLPSELQKRTGTWYTATMVSGAFGGLLAYAVGGLQGRLGYAQWQFLFLIEGLLTVCVGLLGFWLCPDLPGRFKSKIFSAEEMRFLELRVAYKDGPVPPHNEFDKTSVWQALTDWKTYVHASLLAFGGSIPTLSINYTLATMVKQLGYTSVQAQALTAPPYVFAVVVILAAAWFSDKYQSRAKTLLLSYLMGMIGIVILWPCLHYKGTAGASYFALFLVVGGFNAQGPTVGALATNFRNPGKRAVAMGIVGTVGQIIGGVGGANIFIAKEAPYYPTGFGIITGSVILGGVLPISAYWYILRRTNKQRDSMDQQQIIDSHSEEELARLGEHSPLFRYTT